MKPLLASIPSPPSSSISLGPLDMRAYGLAIAISVLVATWITTRRWRRAIAQEDEAYRRRAHDLVGTLAVWAVPAGLLGARLYHVITDFGRYNDDLSSLANALKIWRGGLGIWGGISVGVVVAVWRLRRGGHSTSMMLDALAPALAVAQAIGRLGNWFNQELYGRPTDLPWALEIDPAYRVAGYAVEETFHPTFAYEALWNLALAAALVWVVPRVLPQLRTGYLFAVYVLGYTVGRLWIELLRIDSANELWGMRINVWTSMVVGLAALAALLAGLRRLPVDTGPGGHDPDTCDQGDSGPGADDPATDDRGAPGPDSDDPDTGQARPAAAGDSHPDAAQPDPDVPCADPTHRDAAASVDDGCSATSAAEPPGRQLS